MKMTLQFFALALFCWAVFFVFKKTKGKQQFICVMLIIAGVFMPYTPFGETIRTTLEQVFSTANSTVSDFGSSSH